MFKIIVASIIFMAYMPAMAQHRFDSANENINLAGEEHKILYDIRGSWRQLYEGTPFGGGTPSFGKGSAKNKIIMGGRFIEINALMDTKMIKVENITILGYDKDIRKYTIFQYDNSSTAPTFAYGNYNEKEKMLEFETQMLTDYTGKEKKYRITYTFESKEKFIYELWIIQDGKEHRLFKVVNIKLEE
ncbi:MAG: DUF1579 family protein [Candidatus Kapaibacterium sp.]